MEGWCTYFTAVYGNTLPREKRQLVCMRLVSTLLRTYTDSNKYLQCYCVVLVFPTSYCISAPQSQQQYI